MTATEVGITLRLHGAQQTQTGLDGVRSNLEKVGTQAGAASSGATSLASALGRVAHYGLAAGG